MRSSRYEARVKFREHERCVREDARVALGYAASNSFASFVLSKLPACFISRWTHSWRMNQLFYNIFNPMVCETGWHRPCFFFVLFFFFRSFWGVKNSIPKEKEGSSSSSAGSQLSMFSLNCRPLYLSFFLVLVAVAVVVCLRSLLSHSAFLVSVNFIPQSDSK